MNINLSSLCYAPANRTNQSCNIKAQSFCGLGIPLKTRIELSDSLETAIMKLAEGNRGAQSVCLALFKETPKNDPTNTLGGMGTLLNLDYANVYGSRIWCLYKDVCQEDIGKTIGLLRAVKMGLVEDETFHHALDNRGKGIDLDKVLNQVKNKLDLKS